MANPEKLADSLLLTENITVLVIGFRTLLFLAISLSAASLRSTQFSS